MAAALGFLANCRICRYALIALMLAGAFFGYTAYERHVGADRALAKVEAATAAESSRRLQALKDAQTQAQSAEAEVASLKEHINELTVESARLSAVHDHEPCLDRSAVGRLRAIGRRQTGH